MTKVSWDPKQYALFAADRNRPFHELVHTIDIPVARRVVDLGCGDGTLTATLRNKWPGAYVQGIDSSAEMIAAAERHRIFGELEYRLANIENWEPDDPLDVVISNAALQWVPRHLELIAKIASWLSPGGIFAFQVPGNSTAPSHTAIKEVLSGPRWLQALRERPVLSPMAHEPGDYLGVLLDLGLSARAWETTYYQLLQGDNPVLEWLRGTALRPVLSALSPKDANELLAELAPRLAASYPPGPHGTLLPFRRIFAVAANSAGGA